MLVRTNRTQKGACENKFRVWVAKWWRRLEAAASSLLDSCSQRPIPQIFHCSLPGDTLLMGRTANKSVARVYAEVNAKFGPTWHEYGVAMS